MTPSVSELQGMLAELGAKVAVDGRFNDATRKALRAFQIGWNGGLDPGSGRRALRTDGAADGRTIEALRFSVAERHAQSERESVTAETVRDLAELIRGAWRSRGLSDEAGLAAALQAVGDLARGDCSE